MMQEREGELQVTPLSREAVRLPREAGTLHPSNGREAETWTLMLGQTEYGFWKFFFDLLIFSQ